MSNSEKDTHVDGEEIEDLDSEIANIKKQLSHNPCDRALHYKLMLLLRKNGDLDDLAKLREETVARWPFPSNLWIEWVQDERSSGSNTGRITDLFERAVFDSNSLDVWMEYVQWACGIDSNFAREKFEAAVAAIGLRVDVGAMIWQAYLCFEEAVLAGDDKDEEQVARVNSLYRRALRVPSIDITDIWKSYLEFAGNNIDEGIRSSYEVTTTKMRDISAFEIKLAESDESVQAYHDYLNYEKGSGDPVRIQSFYERILERFPEDEGSWFDYGHWCETQLKIHATTCRVYRRAVRHCPYSCALWQQTLLALERSGASEIEIDKLWTDARETISSAEDGRALYRTYLYMLRRRADSGNRDFSKTAEVFEEGAESLSEWFGLHEWDKDAVYRRNWALFVYTKLKNYEKGRQIWDDILASGGGRFAEKWIEAVRLERQFGSTDRARKLLYKAVNSVSDHPKVVFEYFVQFEREEGTLDQLDKALEKVNTQALHRASRVQSSKQKEVPSNKRKRNDVEKTDSPRFVPHKRPGSTTEDNIPIKKEKVHLADSTSFSQDETSIDKDGFAMPMLPVKKANALSDPSVQSNESTATAKEDKFTVFISNLDFMTTPEQIKQVLDGVVEVRLVYRGRSKLTKGYGFVDLDSEKSYQEALAKDRIPIDGRPMLVSINNPEKRPVFKYSTGMEKSKLFVRNVHHNCTEDQLRDAFSMFGEVKAVRIVTHISGKPKGMAYVEFTKEEDALKAVEAPEIIIHDRKLIVAISNPPQKSAKADSSKSSIDPASLVSTDRKTSLSMVPRGVRTSSKMTANGVSISQGKPMSNDEFRTLLRK